MQTKKRGTEPLSAMHVSGVLQGDQDRTGNRYKMRAFARHSIENCRPIAIRELDGSGAPCGRWFLADIVDVAEGGMCLIAAEGHSLEVGRWLLLDLRSHPGFGQLRLQAQLRWLSHAHFAIAFGVAFATPLEKLPTLSIERRTTHRDPNEEDWAIQEEQERANA